jgi:hypothetical protein
LLSAGVIGVLYHTWLKCAFGQAYTFYENYYSVWDSIEWVNVLKDVTNFFKAVVGKNP